jgi:hypothetical protein
MSFGRKEASFELPKFVGDYEKLLSQFDRVLRGKDKEAIRAAWNKSADMRTLFAGGSIMANKAHAFSFSLMTFTTWYKRFLMVAEQELDYIVEFMLRTNREYASWVYGSNDQLVELSREPEVRAAFPDEILHHFVLMLGCRSAKLVQWLWEDSTDLKRHLFELSPKKRNRYIETAKEAGYQLVISTEERFNAAEVNLTKIPTNKKRKAESPIEGVEIKRELKRSRSSLLVPASQSQESKQSQPFFTESQGSQPDKVIRYFTRSIIASQTHFKLPAPLKRMSSSPLMLDSSPPQSQHSQRSHLSSSPSMKKSGGSQ